MICDSAYYKTEGSTALAPEDLQEEPTNLIDFAKARQSYFHEERLPGQTSSKDIALAFLPCILVGLLFLL